MSSKKKVWDSRDFVLCQDRWDLLINEVTEIKFKKIIFLHKSLKNQFIELLTRIISLCDLTNDSPQRQQIYFSAYRFRHAKFKLHVE